MIIGMVLMAASVNVASRRQSGGASDMYGFPLYNKKRVVIVYTTIRCQFVLLAFCCDVCKVFPPIRDIHLLLSMQ